MATSMIKTNMPIWNNGNSWMTSGEVGDGGLQYTYDDNMVCISFVTASKQHEADNVIFTVPEEYRPAAYNVICTVFTNGGYANAIQIRPSTGQAVLWTTPPVSPCRIVGNCIYYRRAK